MPASDMEVLGVRESLDLLGSVSLGRLVFTENALPAIRPVNFALLRGDIFLRAEGALARRLDQVVVAFEADEFDPATERGWSVVVLGRARVIRELERLAQLGAAIPPPWEPGGDFDVLCISVERITGRRLTLHSEQAD